MPSAHQLYLEWRADPTDAREAAWMAAQREEAAVLREELTYGDGFPNYCNTCGREGGRHSYHCHNDR